MRKCILHVGPHKTGTTSIQATLSNELTDPCFDYARLGRTNQGSLIRNVFADGSKALSRQRERGLTAKDIRISRNRARKKLLHAVSADVSKSVLISGEDISLMAEEDLRQLHDFLKEHFDTIEVIGYVRPPASWFTSIFQQVIKTRSESVSPLRIYRSYRACFEKLDKVFGREQVRLFKFDPAIFPNGDVVRHFFSVVGLAAPERVHRSNESLPRSAVQVLYAYHKFVAIADRRPGARASRMSTAKVLVALPGGRFRFAPNLIEPIIAANLNDITWAETRLGLPLDEAPADDADAIRGEADMLSISGQTIVALETLAGTNAPRPARDMHPAEYAARLVEYMIDERRMKRESRRTARNARFDSGKPAS